MGNKWVYAFDELAAVERAVGGRDAVRGLLDFISRLVADYQPTHPDSPSRPPVATPISKAAIPFPRDSGKKSWRRSRASKHAPASDLATPRTRCSSPAARARASRCPA